MIKKIPLFSLFLFLPILLCGFISTSEKTTSTALIYCATVILAVLVFLVYIFGIRKKNPWFILLFSSVFVVNLGYLALSVSGSLEEALLANRIAYLGSVFLPMAMLMLILDLSKTAYKKWMTGLLIGVGIAIFLIAASPGYLDIYYKDVSFSNINGVSVLEKVYGPLHILYLFYLLSYFVAMSTVTVIKTRQKQFESTVQACVILAAVFINILVWLLEQFIKIDFEILSVSYILTEFLLVCVCFLLQESERQNEKILTALQEKAFIAAEQDLCPDTITEQTDTPVTHEPLAFVETEEYKNFMYGLGMLTHTENIIYNYYVEGKSTKEILVLLDITENTLKYHNKNIYGKLGVSSRKQLKEIALKIAGNH